MRPTKIFLGGTKMSVKKLWIPEVKKVLEDATIEVSEVKDITESRFLKLKFDGSEFDLKYEEIFDGWHLTGRWHYKLTDLVTYKRKFYTKPNSVVKKVKELASKNKIDQLREDAKDEARQETVTDLESIFNRCVKCNLTAPFQFYYMFARNGESAEETKIAFRKDTDNLCDIAIYGNLSADQMKKIIKVIESPPEDD